MNRTIEPVATAGDTAAVPFVDQSCRGCQFWWDRGEYTGKLKPNGKREMTTDGDCRIRPPRMCGADATAVWPRTEQHDWCARWRLREEED